MLEKWPLRSGGGSYGWGLELSPQLLVGPIPIDRKEFDIDILHLVARIGRPLESPTNYSTCLAREQKLSGRKVPLPVLGYLLAFLLQYQC